MHPGSALWGYVFRQFIYAAIKSIVEVVHVSPAIVGAEARWGFRSLVQDPNNRNETSSFRTRTWHCSRLSAEFPSEFVTSCALRLEIPPSLSLRQLSLVAYTFLTPSFVTSSVSTLPCVPLRSRRTARREPASGQAR